MDQLQIHGAGGGGGGGVAVSAGTESQSTGTIIFADSNGVTFGLNAGTVTATVQTNYLTTAMLSNAATISNIRLSAGTTSNLASAFTFADGNGVSFGLNAGTITGSVDAAVPSPINFSAGTTSNNLGSVVFSNSNGISFGLDGSTITAQHNALTSQSNQALSGSNGSFTFQTATFGSSNGMHFYTTNGSLVGSYTVPTQSNQTVGLYASSNTYLTSSGTVDARSLTFRGDKSITVGISASEVLFSVGAYITTGALSGDTTKYVQAWELTGNTAGTTSSAQGTKIYFQGGNNITVSGSSNSIVISAGAGGAGSNTFGMSNVGNTAGTSGVISGSALQMLVVGGPNITVSQSINGSSATLSISAAAPGGAGAARSYFNWPEVVANSSAVQISGSSKYLQPIEIPHDLSVSFMRMPCTFSCVGSNAATATAANQTVGCTISSTIQVAFYSLGAGASSLSLQSYFTTSTLWLQQLTIRAAGVGSNWSSGHTISYPNASGANSSFGTSAAATSASRTMNSTVISNFTNLLFFHIPLATSFSAGMYWMAYNSSTSQSTSVSNWLSTQRILASNFAVSQPAQSINVMGAATNSSNLYPLGQGDWSTNSIGATTGSIQLAALSRRASNPILYFDMIRIA